MALPIFLLGLGTCLQSLDPMFKAIDECLQYLQSSHEHVLISYFPRGLFFPNAENLAIKMSLLLNKLLFPYYLHEVSNESFFLPTCFRLNTQRDQERISQTRFQF